MRPSQTENEIARLEGRAAQSVYEVVALGVSYPTVWYSHKTKQRYLCIWPMTCLQAHRPQGVGHTRPERPRIPSFETLFLQPERRQILSCTVKRSQHLRSPPWGMQQTRAASWGVRRTQRCWRNSIAQRAFERWTAFPLCRSPETGRSHVGPTQSSHGPPVCRKDGPVAAPRSASVASQVPLGAWRQDVEREKRRP